MNKRALMCGMSACTTTFVLEPKHFPDPLWRGLAFGWDAARSREFDGLLPRRRAEDEAFTGLTATTRDGDATFIRWKDYGVLQA